MNSDRFVDSQLTDFANLVHDLSVFCIVYWITFGKLSAGALTQQKKLKTGHLLMVIREDPLGLGQENTTSKLLK